jgi:hypothetical protein
MNAWINKHGWTILWILVATTILVISYSVYVIWG